jgi:hypothetical protein
MDWEYDDSEHTTRYRLCRAGFALSALGLALMSIDSIFWLAVIFTRNWQVLHLVRSPYYDWSVGVTITWSTLLGPFLLWGRWSEPRWRRRAGLLVVLNLLDVGYWVLRHGALFGLYKGELPHPYLISNLVLASSWVQFGLFASLADDVAAHLGARRGPEPEMRARTLSTAGGAVWVISMLSLTDWRHWPLNERFTPLWPLLRIGTFVLRVVASFQAAVLCLVACRACSQILRDLGHSPHDAGLGDRDLDALRSRSEDAFEELWGSGRGRGKGQG